MQSLDAGFTSEVTRRDDPNIIALNRQQARFLGVRLAYMSGGYLAGTVLGKNSVSGLWMAYNDSGSSGENSAVAILEKPVPEGAFVDTTAQSASNSVVVPAIFGGTVFYDKLVGIDANGVTDLKGRQFTDVTGASLMSF